MPMRDPAAQSLLAKLLEEHGLTGQRRLYREAERASLQPGATAGSYRLAANPNPGESVVDVYGPGYVVQAESVGAGLAFAESARPNWQETMELRTMRAMHDKAHPAGERVEVETTVDEILKQGGLIYPVESVTEERAWYCTLPSGAIEVRLTS